MPKATAPEETSTPAKLQIARPHHGHVRLQRMRVNYGRNRVGRIVKAIDELEAQRGQQRHAQQKKREDRGADGRCPCRARC